MRCPTQKSRQGNSNELEVKIYTNVCKLVSLQQYNIAKEQAWVLYTNICSSWGVQTSDLLPSTKLQQHRTIRDRIVPVLPRPACKEARQNVALVVGTVSNLFLCTIHCYESSSALDVLQDCAVLCKGLEPWIRCAARIGRCVAALHSLLLVYASMLIHL